ncbi:MAG: hypothetical protein ACK56W_02370 [Pirellula sp.]|jgi:hypothetical protein|nr:hypothetical protein [Pirellula sp.]
MSNTNDSSNPYKSSNAIDSSNAKELTEPVSPAPKKSEPLLDRQTTRIVMFVVLFGVTGFLGLPALWISKSFTPSEKIFWSIINTIYTLILIGITAAICWWSYRQIFGTY